MSLKGFVTLDIETTTTAHLGHKASPFTDENWTVAAAYAVGKGPVIGSYWGNDRTKTDGYLAGILAQHQPQYIVGFNIKFDILHLIRTEQDYLAYQAWVVAGGQLWDAQLVEYLLEGQRKEAHMLSLDEVAPRYGGSLKIDEVKAMWNAGINTPDIPKQLLMDYLVGRDLADGTRDFGDIENTRVTFLGQVEAAKKAGQVKSIQLNNGALVATIEMERNGLHVNMQLGRDQSSKLRQQLIGLTESLQTSLPKDLPFEFKWNSPRQLSALIFGGSIPYPVRVHQMDDAGQPAYAMKEVTGWVLTDGSTTTVPPGGKFDLGQYATYAGGKKAGTHKTKQVKVPDHDKPKMKIETFHYHMPGYAKPEPWWEGKTKGVYSTKAEVIDELGGQGIEFLDNFADMKDIAKDLGTYYITEEYDEDGEVVPGKSKGMLTLVGADGIVHANISMVSTVTGRFAHSRPNIGNLPRSDTSDVKQMFTSRWGEDGFMLSSDFSSLEVYTMAMLSYDEQLISDLIAGLDMHIKRLSQAEAKPYEELYHKIKVLQEKEWINKRKNIKVFSFQRQYGAGAPKIARGLKLPKELIEQWIIADDLMYPGVVRFGEKTATLVKQSRVPEMRFQQHPKAKINVQLGSGKLRTFDGKVYVFREQIAPDFMFKKGVLSSFKPTEMKNYPVQGLGGEWMKAAMWIAVRAFYFYGNFGGLALLVNTVHDALYADAHKDVRRKVGVVLHASMLAASDLIEYWFGKPVPVPVPSETTYGPSMFHEDHFEEPEAFNASAQKMRSWLRKQFMGGYLPSYLQE